MRVLFIGTGDIGLPSLEWLLNTTKHEVVGVVGQPHDAVVAAEPGVLPAGEAPRREHTSELVAVGAAGVGPDWSAGTGGSAAMRPRVYVRFFRRTPDQAPEIQPPTRPNTSPWRITPSAVAAKLRSTASPPAWRSVPRAAG